MKKINDWVIRTFGLRGSWSWAKKQMLNGAIIYQVFLTDSKEIIQHMIHGVIYGKWTFVKRGENFGIKLVKVLPGIHKCILRIAEKDIFGHESK